MRRFIHEIVIWVRLSLSWTSPRPETARENCPGARESRERTVPPRATSPSVVSVDTLAAVLLGVGLFISPLSSYFFSLEPLPAGTLPVEPLPGYMLAAAAFALLACQKTARGKLDLLSSPLNKALFFLLILAVLSSINPWDRRGAVGLCLLLSSCFAVCWTTSTLMSSPAAARGLTLSITAGGAAVSIMMLTQIVQGSTAPESLYSLGALLTAAYLCCCSLLSYYETAPEQTASNTAFTNPTAEPYKKNLQKTLHKLLHQPALKSLIKSALFTIGYLNLLAVISLGLRVAYAVILLGIILLLFTLTIKKMRQNALGIILIQGVSVLLVINPVYHSFAAGCVPAGWIWAGAGFILSIILLHTWHRLKQYSKPQPIEADPGTVDPKKDLWKPPRGNPSRGNGTRRLRPWVLPAAAALLFLVIVIIGTPNIQLLAHRAAGVQSYPLAELMLRCGDALKAMAAAPHTLLLGSGGSGWPALISMHQSFYYEEPAPGVFLQAGVELGVCGLFAVLIIWGIFIIEIKQLIKMSGITAEQKILITAAARKMPESSFGSRFEQKALVTAVASGALALGCHSLLWSGFSSAAALYLFALFGIGNGLNSQLRFIRPETARMNRPPARRLPKIIITGIGIPKIPLPRITLINTGISQLLITGLSKIKLPKFRPPKIALPKFRLWLAGSRAETAAAGSQQPYAGICKCLAVLSAAALIFIISLSIFMGERSARTAAEAIEKGDTMTALHNMEKAIKHDPFNSTYHKQMGILYLESAPINRPDNGNSTPGSAAGAVSPGTSSDQENLTKAEHHFKKGLGLSRGDVELRLLYAETLFQLGKVEQGAEQLKEAVKLRPLQQNLYEYLSLGYLTAGRFLLEQAKSLEKKPGKTPEETLENTLDKTPEKVQERTQKKTPEKAPDKILEINLKETPAEAPAETGNQEAPGNTPNNQDSLYASSYLTAALKVPGKLEKRRALLNKNHLKYWRGSPYLGISPEIQLYSGEAAALLGYWPQAVHYLDKAARDVSLRPEAMLMNGLVFKRTGRTLEGEALIIKALQEKPELAAEQKRLEELLTDLFR